MQTSVPSDERLTEAERRRLAWCAGAGFFLSPGAWLLQVIISETISAQTCDAITTPLDAPGVWYLHAWLYGASIAALVISIVCAGLATYGFLLLQRRQKRINERRKYQVSGEKSSREEEEVGRKRFIALCSALIGCGFVVGLVFTMLAEVFLVSCSQWH
ncbi:hypothetical protein [Burkholderia sp. WSM2230]|uniref:hypothetical protein n=1 Tax=Burkholderia sp. WSM2230 TaxID=944435 RepID=UPI000470400C|nr:hypothetical protein [Burkholderia sp. WSM2230]